MSDRARTVAERVAARRMRRREGLRLVRGLALAPADIAELVLIGILEPGDAAGDGYDLGAGLAMGLTRLAQLHRAKR